MNFVLKGSENVRLRQVQKTAAGSGSTEEDLDTVLKYHHNMQERLAEEMVQLARDLKENARVAGKIVQDDNKVVHSFCLQLEPNFNIKLSVIAQNNNKIEVNFHWRYEVPPAL